MKSETQASSYVAGSYTYDGDGRRVRRKVGDVETWQVYGMDGELLAEYVQNGAVTSPQKEYGYRNGQLLITAEAPAASAARTNFALAANGGTASASSVLSTSYPAASVNNGDRKGLNWGSGGGWRDAEPGSTFPDWVEVNFSGSRTIDEVDVFTVQDSYASPSAPTEAMTFSLYGLSGYDVQYWNGSSWVTVSGGNVSSNNKVWKKFSFTVVTTSKIRVLANASVDGYSRLVEVEAWGDEVRTNVAAAASGGSASASSELSSSFPASSVNNGDRKGLNWGSGGGWRDAEPGNTFPDWVEIDFSGSQTIDEIDVFTVQDSYGSPAEPSETQTFSLYGLTGYEVQYWNGSAWATVSGGNVSSNNKVWRKISFSPITTTKIRVLTNAAVDGYSRLTEVEAWTVGSGSSTSNINWLVTDQLGTPRMMFDKTGSLANTKRHDYLPFGEELFAGTGGRTTGEGYVGDNNRFKFTTYERDVETGLDYAQARYYASAQGRFTSPDPFMGSGKTAVPQSWNRYTYCANSPLVLVDPSGLDWGYYDLGKGKASIVWFEGEVGKYKGRQYKPIDFGKSSSMVLNLVGGSRVQIFQDGRSNPLGPNTSTPPQQQQSRDDSLPAANQALIRQVAAQPFEEATAAFALASVMQGATISGSSLLLLDAAAAAGLVIHDLQQQDAAAAEAANLILQVESQGSRFGPNQAALVDLAKEAKRGGVTPEQAKILIQWANDYGVKPAENNIGTKHWVGGDHIRVGPVNHIAVKPR